ncbi:MAG: hypothetical protein HY961_14190 [Ignavibacteriae bacterium]|nr:hypothetical protein [Ignavibacteriota bacterium]
MKYSHQLILLFAMLVGMMVAHAQQRNYYPHLMTLDAGNIHLSMNKLNGDGGMQSQFSWNLTGANRQNTEIFYWPRDVWQTNMLYQIFNPISLDDNGIMAEDSLVKPMYSRGEALTNASRTDWAAETRRYRPPHVTVDGIALDAPYRWYVDPSLKSDIKIEFEDVLPQFGIRSHVEVFAFSNPMLADFFIWKATHKFTGEVRLPRESTSSKDSLPDQTIRFWWPLSFNFGPSKIGERAVSGGFSYEGEDDLDSWFKQKSTLAPARPRDSLYVAYVWDAFFSNTVPYTNGSVDDTGDPDRINGYLYSTQIPGFTLLHADQSASIKTDDRTQPYSLPHASIVGDLWGRRDVGLKQTYRGDDARGRFPLDPITAGFSTTPQKGTMRFVTVGPYSLTKNRAQNRADSVTFVYGVGTGSISPTLADSIGRDWLAGRVSDSLKKAIILTGKDSLWKTLDRANWTWDRMSRGLSIPSPPPSPDITVTSGPDIITVQWSYSEASYYNDPVTGVDDWYAWRVYRKRGALLTHDPLDQKSKAKWELAYETTNRGEQTYIDHNIQRGVDYYYAVTAVDNGLQATDWIYPGQRLESNRFTTMSQLPAVSFKPGLNEAGKVRVVPNPATVAAGRALNSGTPDKISFFNLPIKCTLRIFTETGDQITTLDHYGTADHQWNQRTDENQYVTSGIYILAVTDAEDINGKSLDTQFVKFIIVR